MIPDELEIYIARMTQQYNEMLGYRENIQAEIDVKSNELRQLKDKIVKIKTDVETAEQAQKKAKDDFLTDNKAWIEQLKSKEKELSDKEQAILLSITEFEKIKAEIEGHVKENSNILAQINKEREELNRENLTFQTKCREIVKKTAELDDRETRIVSGENKILERYKSIADWGVAMRKFEDKLKIDQLEVIGQKKLLDEQRKDIESDRLRLQSQQEAFKLAVMEAKRRWPQLTQK
jgi:chromosome segregation ATPase